MLEFLDLGDRKVFHERELEQAIIDRIEAFLLEMGKGFCFVGRQRRLTVEGDHFFELYAVFSSPQYYRVIGPTGSDVGSLEEAFVDNLVEDMTSFLLGGRAWLVHSIDHKSRTVSVRPAPRGKAAVLGRLRPQDGLIRGRPASAAVRGARERQQLCKKCFTFETP